MLSGWLPEFPPAPTLGAGNAGRLGFHGGVALRRDHEHLVLAVPGRGRTAGPRLATGHEHLANRAQLSGVLHRDIALVGTSHGRSATPCCSCCSPRAGAEGLRRFRSRFRFEVTPEVVVEESERSRQVDKGESNKGLLVSLFPCFLPTPQITSIPAPSTTSPMAHASCPRSRAKAQEGVESPAAPDDQQPAGGLRIVQQRLLPVGDGTGVGDQPVVEVVIVVRAAGEDPRPRRHRRRARQPRQRVEADAEAHTGCLRHLRRVADQARSR